MYSMSLTVGYQQEQDDHKMQISFSDSDGVEAKTSVESDDYNECLSAATQELMEEIQQKMEEKEIEEEANYSRYDIYDTPISDLIDENILLDRENKKLKDEIEKLNERLNRIEKSEEFDVYENPLVYLFKTLK